jgi:hypothetical protein
MRGIMRKFFMLNRLGIQCGTARKCVDLEENKLDRKFADLAARPCRYSSAAKARAE